MEVKNEESSTTGATTSTEYEWMIRPCDQYIDEFKECTSIKGRFHQHFIFGEPLDCSQWKKDYNTCLKLEKDPKAKEELIKSEKIRYAKRMIGHVKNDVWENREAPPEDWSKPLPEWMQKTLDGTYLDMKNKEMKSSEGRSVYEERTLCVIM
ncbi:UPF0545 protein C22orf39 homolog [Neocloeon triangulifer]|uniref:UPF0545 protein C22orf39 homolog n=1 Tax=Neocloeon triangulifer TaxID=2078957 RepID=UPI00286F3377|nr:UPF0545 protein C22orf39 homolog [Neocloeon triangulifer]